MFSVWQWWDRIPSPLVVAQGSLLRGSGVPSQEAALMARAPPLPSQPCCKTSRLLEGGRIKLRGSGGLWWTFWLTHLFLEVLFAVMLPWCAVLRYAKTCTEWMEEFLHPEGANRSVFSPQFSVHCSVYRNHPSYESQSSHEDLQGSLVGGGGSHVVGPGT